MSQEKQDRISTSSTVRMRLFRQRVLPFLVWALAIGAVATLYLQQNRQVSTLGLVQSEIAAIAPLNNGRLQGVHVSLLDEVNAGQVVAVMDDAKIESALQSAQSELARLQVAFSTTQAASARTDGQQRRQVQLDRAEARLALLGLSVQLQVNRFLAARTLTVLQRQQRLVAAAAMEASVYEQTLDRHQQLTAEIERVQAMIDPARDRLASIPAATAAQADSLMLPLQQGLDAEESRVRDIQSRLATRELRSPVTGTVTEILHQEGDAVSAGAPVLRVTHRGSSNILVYVDEATAPHLQEGSEAGVSPQTEPGKVRITRVAKVGSSMVERPIQLRRSQRNVEWGVPVVLAQAADDAQAFFPGQVVVVHLSVD